jgi:DNA-binding transcriptional MocR family regulator
MILNSENSIVLELDWQTTIWEISAKFEFRELWFTPQSWIHPKADEKHSNILHSYAFLSSLIITEGTITILMKNFRLIITDSRLLTFLGTIKDI